MPAATVLSVGRPFGSRTEATLTWPPRISARAAAEMDALRAGAALLVAAGHVRAVLFAPWADVSAKNPMLQIVYFGTSLGHQAVMIFFVLSGFLITTSVFRSFRGRYWSWRWYLSRRLSRLWVVLIPALVICTAWDFAGLLRFSDSGVYTGAAGNMVLEFVVAARLTPLVFIGNAAFLQGVVVPPYGSDAPLWSLSFEWWYYLLWALLACAIFARQARWRVLSVMAGAAVLLFVGRDIAAYFPIWLLGLIPAFGRQRQLVRFFAVRKISAVCLLVAALTVLRFIPTAYVSDLAVAAATAILLRAFTMRAGGEGEGYVRAGAAVRTLASFSYTLYLVHLPPLVFMYAWRRTHSLPLWQPTLPHLLAAFAILGALVCYAYLVSLVTERHTDKVRAFMEQLLPRKTAFATSGSDVHG